MSIEFKNIEKFCLCCGKKLKLNNTRDIDRKNFCSRECNGSFMLKKLWKKEDYANRIKEVNTGPNPKKANHGKNHPKWIEDRTKLKQKRCIYEEKSFFKEVMKERNFLCEITNLNGKLSVHHLDSVSLFPDKRYNKDNVILILYDIHKEFHNMYGYNNIKKENWLEYIESKHFEKWKNKSKNICQVSQ